MTLQNLLAIQRLQAHTPDGAAIRRLLAAARRNLADVLDGHATLAEVVVPGPSGLRIVPAASGTQAMVQLGPREHAGLISAFSEIAHQMDVLIVDTAGRLQNKAELMDELAKIRRVLGRLNPEAPHDVVLVLDATNGQNALQQIEVFKEVAGVTGLIMTKLDGTARGGVLVAAAEQYGLPIHAIGVGEKIDDLRPFDPDLVARVIAGVA